jgi:hypothetical protein
VGFTLLSRLARTLVMWQKLTLQTCCSTAMSQATHTVLRLTLLWRLAHTLVLRQKMTIKAKANSAAGHMYRQSKQAALHFR